MQLFILLVLVGVAVAHKPYIVGGNDATLGKWPHMGSVRLPVVGHICGISLISPTWGVTSALIVKYAPMSSLTVQFGSNDRTKGGQIVHVRQVIVHDNFDEANQLANDIAVVEFTEAVTAEYAKAIPMAGIFNNPNGNTDCWITGWGQTSFNGNRTKILQEAHVRVYTTNDECDAGYDKVCVGGDNSGRGSCMWDQGSPLVCRVNGQYVLVGASSWDFFCSTTYDSIYSRVGYFRSWIRGKTGV